METNKISQQPGEADEMWDGTWTFHSYGDEKPPGGILDAAIAVYDPETNKLVARFKPAPTSTHLIEGSKSPQDDDVSITRDGSRLSSSENQTRKVLVQRRGKPNLLTSDLFSGLELFARLIPFRARQRCFEPAYQECKGEYLLTRRKFRGKLPRIWLGFCFVINVLTIMVQAIWSTSTERALHQLGNFLGAAFGWLKGG